MDVVMPQLGETVTEGTIATWFKTAGETVVAGDTLLEIETDKVSMEVQALGSGVLSEIRVPVGQTVKVGAVLAVIESGPATRAASPVPAVALATPAIASAPVVAAKASLAAPMAPLQVAPPPRNGAAAPAGHGLSLAERGFAPFNEVMTPTVQFGSAKGPGGIRITPLARRLIALNGLDVAAVAAEVRAKGGDKVRRDDVLATLAARTTPAALAMQATPLTAQPAAEAAAATTTRSSAMPVGEGSRPTGGQIAPGAGQTVVPLNRIRQTTGRHLTQSWQSIPHVFQTTEIDFDRVTRARAELKDAFRTHHGVALTFMPFIARALCLAIQAFPQVNARLDGDRLVVSRDVHLGIAVDLSHDGLVVPVIRHADLMTVAGLAKAIDRQVEKARAGRLTLEDFEGGTYTLSNNGAFGTLFTAPIINPPQVAILSTDAIKKRPVVMETEVGDVIVARPVGIVAQSFDHRAFDGAYSAAFLARLKQIIETRDWAAEIG